MHLFALIGAALAVAPIELSADVFEIAAREFTMPLRVDPTRQDKIDRIRLFVSEDLGKTWKQKEDYSPNDTQVEFTASRDGQYWFALQVAFKDGTCEPADLANLIPRKVYVNTTRRAFKVQKSYEELQCETERLRKKVEELEKKIKELEAERHRK